MQNLIARLFGWLWAPEATSQAPEEDRSSMADLVRLLSTDEPASGADDAPQQGSLPPD
jgi:hypothetical protein